MPYANNNGVRINYEIEGQGPPLLLQHGFSGTLDAWRTNGYVQSLSKEYRCIFLSIRGRGKSDKPHNAASYSYKNLISDLVAVLDDAGVKKARYLGYSMGGAIGFRIPLYAPDRFYSLTLGGAGYNPGKAIQGYNDDLGAAYAAMEQAVKEGVSNPMETFFRLYEKTAGTVPPERKAVILAQDGVALAAACKASREDIGPAPSDYLPTFKLPCFIYAGEADPRCPDAKESAKLVPGAQTLFLPGLNHNQVNAGELMLPPIKKFLAEVSKKHHAE